MPVCEASFEAWAFVYALVTAAFACGFGLACAFRGCDDDAPVVEATEPSKRDDLFVGGADEERCQTLSGRDERAPNPERREHLVLGGRDGGIS